jgi:hypothetical protein
VRRLCSGKISFQEFSLRFEIPKPGDLESRNKFSTIGSSEVSLNRSIQEDIWQTTSADHNNKDVWEIYVSKYIWQITSADHVRRACGRPRQQGHVVDHVSKDAWKTT